jgi:DNA-binding HxlR family transcriptional regulator
MSPLFSVSIWNLLVISCEHNDMKWSDLENDTCPIARSLSVVGDRWTLLILRDCFVGKTRFDAFQKSLGLTRHVLAERLAKLVEAGVLSKEAYAKGRYDYRLTRQGKALAPVLSALFDWGAANVAGEEVG